VGAQSNGYDYGNAIKQGNDYSHDLGDHPPNY
jgi:hypothetical protein